MSKFRAILITGRTSDETRKGPIRKERFSTYEDLSSLEKNYPPFKGRIVDDAGYDFTGESDDIFEE